MASRLPPIFSAQPLDYERARQDLVYVRAQADLLPVRVAQDRARLYADLVETGSELDALIQRRDLAQADHDIALLRREERIASKYAFTKQSSRRNRLGQRDTARRDRMSRPLPIYQTRSGLICVMPRSYRKLSVGRSRKSRLFTLGPKLIAET